MEIAAVERSRRRVCRCCRYNPPTHPFAQSACPPGSIPSSSPTRSTNPSGSTETDRDRSGKRYLSSGLCQHRYVAVDAGAPILMTLPDAHCPQRVWADVPHQTGTMLNSSDRHRPSWRRCRTASACVATAVIANSHAVTAVCQRPVIRVTEPGAVLKQQPSYPFVLDLRHRLNAHVGMEVFSVGVDLHAVADLRRRRSCRLATGGCDRECRCCSESDRPPR